MRNADNSFLTTIPLNQAIGKVLAHDVTEIRPGEYKGPAFKKGYVIKEEDLPHLQRLGKENLYVLDIPPGYVHEDTAASRLAPALAGPGIVYDPEPSEGKISLKAGRRGLFKVNIEALVDLNMQADIICSSRHNNLLVEQGETLAATRVIPLIIEEHNLVAGIRVAEASGGIFSVKKLASPHVGIVITGNEVTNRVVEDRFSPILKKKFHSYHCNVQEILFVPDKKEQIVRGINQLLDRGAGLLVVAGGMSVDPDDVSPAAIAAAGAKDMVYGTPVLPGAMFMYGRFSTIPVLGVPACALYYRATVLDLLLPRVLAGEIITRRDLATMAHGGLCLNCRDCRYPLCPFGK